MQKGDLVTIGKAATPWTVAYLVPAAGMVALTRTVEHASGATWIRNRYIERSRVTPVPQPTDSA
jgi:hypothetical protein